MSRYRLTRAAEHDIEAILRETTRTFGTVQRDRYADIIRIGIRMVAEEHERPGSRLRDGVHPDVRSVHLDLAAGRIGGAAHYIFYRKQKFADGESGVAVLRILHERMDVGHHPFETDE